MADRGMRKLGGFTGIVAMVAILMLVGEAPGGASAISSEAKEFLSEHNKARSQVDVGALEWSDDLAAYARKYGEQQRDHHQCAMVHSRGPYGENLFWGYGKRFTPTDAVRSWEKESEHFDYDANACAPGKVCGHYTQLVWADSKKLGCASVSCHDGATFVICSYDPPGNFVSERPYQRSKLAEKVSPPLKESKSQTNLASADDAHDGDLNKADAKLCQCMLSCVSKSKFAEWRHSAAQ